MKSRILMWFTTLIVFAAAAAPVRLDAQGNEEGKKHKHHHYKLVDIDTFGGPSSYYNTLSLRDRFPGFVYPDGFARVINKRALMVGWADTSRPDPDPNYCLVSGYDCHVAHAFQWRNGIETDLESLPGGASSVAFWVNSSGLSVGFAESGQSEEVSTANLIMTDRKSLEKVGVFPDERILAKPEDIVRGRDPVRARAAELGGVKITPDEAGPTATDSGSGPPIIDGPGWVRDHNTTFSSTRTGHCEAICPSIRCPQLDGYCVGLVRRVCQRRYVGGRDCPVHAPARRMVGECGVYVDPTTFCTP